MESTQRNQSSTEFKPSSTLLILGFVSLFADISSEMLYPITPIFVTTILGASVAHLGLIEGFAECLASLLKVFSGASSDQQGQRRHFVFAGYLLSAVSKPFIGLSTHWSQIFAARGMDRLGKGLRSAPRDALIAESTEPENYGAAFGWHRGMDTLGAAIGALVAVFFLSYFSDLRTAFAWAFLPGLISALLVLRIKEATKHENSNLVRSNKISLLKQIRNTKLDSKLKKYLAIWFLFSIGNSSDVFLILKSKQIMQDHRLVILQYALFSLSFALLAPKLGRLSDRLPREKILSFGFFSFALVYAGFALATEAWQLWILFLFYGVYLAATDGVGKAVLAKLAAPESKAAVMGLHGTLTGLAAFIASLAAGYIWDYSSAFYCFMIGASFAAVAAILMWLLETERKLA